LNYLASEDNVHSTGLRESKKRMQRGQAAPSPHGEWMSEDWHYFLCLQRDSRSIQEKEISQRI